MQTWIFQGNPDRFDVDTYLAAWRPEFPWLVRQHASEIKVKDRVFIWRAAGSRKGIAGIVAEAIVTQATEPRWEDDFGKTLWRGNSGEGDQKLDRALLRLKRVATVREVIKHEWLREDPLLKSMKIVTIPRQTNYRVAPQDAARLSLLWSRVGQDWTRNESLAGLWAYARTRRGVVSKLPGSPVAEVALLIGRPVSGVYIKVLNFRSLDPDNSGGMPSVSETDRRVWAEFFEPSAGELNVGKVEDEFERLWKSPGPARGIPANVEVTEALARRLEAESLASLLARYSAARQVNPGTPTVNLVETRAFDRDPLAVSIVRKRAAHRFEVPACYHPTLTTSDGLPYCEVHHIVPLSEGGRDVIENMACVCPTHHREAHWGINKAEIAAVLLKVRLPA